MHDAQRTGSVCNSVSGSVVKKLGTQMSQTYCWMCQPRFRIRARRRTPRTLQKSSQKAVREVQAYVRALLEGRQAGQRRLPECSKQSVKKYSNWWPTNHHMDIPNEMRELVTVC